MSNIKLIILGALLAATIGGCSSDCPTCPGKDKVKPYRGWLFYSDLRGTRTGVYRIDMETDSIVDTIPSPFGSALGLGITADGSRLFVGYYAASDLKTTLVYDAQTLQLLSDLGDLTIPFIDNKQNLFIGGKVGKMKVYDLNSLALRYSDSLPGFDPQEIDENNHLVYGIGDNSVGFRYFAFDYVARRFVDTIDIAIDESGVLDTLHLYDVCLNSRSNILYFIGAGSQWAYFGGFDLRSRQLLWNHATLSQFGGLALTPDNKELYFTDPGPYWDPMVNTGTIFVYDAKTGDRLEGISLSGYTNIPCALPASSILFSPLGDKAYVATGWSGIKRSGSVLVVDTKTQKITRIISPELDRIPFNMVLGPKD